MIFRHGFISQINISICRSYTHLCYLSRLYRVFFTIVTVIHSSVMLDIIMVGRCILGTGSICRLPRNVNHAMCCRSKVPAWMSQGTKIADLPTGRRLFWSTKTNVTHVEAGWNTPTVIGLYVLIHLQLQSHYPRTIDAMFSKSFGL